ncbi:unnamed protein product [Rotaria sp. Silwood1]|nr:unnamed protein product [Rotaria sp. Silwood1]CAF3448047.1 unnamed protein product [Rotaria sp. Silwood1]CAF4875154.1 unnamed protein product [Rotaria sp. Silwood1]
MPAITKDKYVTRVQTPARIHPRSLGPNDVKRLGPSQRINVKRTQTQSIQTQTVLACVILNNAYKQIDEATQTNDDIDNDNRSAVSGIASRLIKFFGGKIVALMKLFNDMK